MALALQLHTEVSLRKLVTDLRTEPLANLKLAFITRQAVPVHRNPEKEKVAFAKVPPYLALLL